MAHLAHHIVRETLFMGQNIVLVYIAHVTTALISTALSFIKPILLDFTLNKNCLAIKLLGNVNF